MSCVRRSYLKTRLSTTGKMQKAFKRLQSTALHFYQNRQLELYASKEAKRLTLRQLVFFGRAMNEERLIKSANYVRTELPVRIAHRLRDLQALPYVVVTQEDVARVYELYWLAFEKIRRFPQVNTLAENEAFCSFLREVLEEHAGVIPRLSLGLSISSPHLPSDQLDSFMRRMLVSRISRRVLAEHHLALTESLKSSSKAEGNVGIIDTKLDVKRSIEKCVKLLRQRPFCLEETWEEVREQDVGRQWSDVVVDGHLETRFPYIKEHLEYIVFELLKNALWATGLKYVNSRDLPPVRATIAAGADDVTIRISDEGGGLDPTQIKAPADLFSFSHIRNATRMDTSRLGALRTVTSSSKGLRATVDEQVDSWWTNEGAGERFVDNDEKQVENKRRVAPHLRIGIGLPMSNIFATYFGGSLDLVSLDGLGTDAYVRLPKLGTNLEGIEV